MGLRAGRSRSLDLWLGWRRVTRYCENLRSPNGHVASRGKDFDLFGGMCGAGDDMERTVEEFIE